MELKISKKTEQPLFRRTLLEGVVSFEKVTPSRSELRKKIADSLKSNESFVAVTKIANAFGKRQANIEAYIYKSKEDFDKQTSISIKGRHKTAGGDGKETKEEKKT